MELFGKLIDLVMHLDVHLNTLIVTYQLWTYLILFAIIFCETGLVVTPFLPGDSLLFATGALAACPAAPASPLAVPGPAAPPPSSATRSTTGSATPSGPKVFNQKKIRFLNKEHLERTHAFYEKYGGITIILARFIPIIRTFAPFVAGIGAHDLLALHQLTTSSAASPGWPSSSSAATSSATCPWSGATSPSSSWPSSSSRCCPG